MINYYLLILNLYYYDLFIKMSYQSIYHPKILILNLKMMCFINLIMIYYSMIVDLFDSIMVLIYETLCLILNMLLNEQHLLDIRIFCSHFIMLMIMFSMNFMFNLSVLIYYYLYKLPLLQLITSSKSIIGISNAFFIPTFYQYTYKK